MRRFLMSRSLFVLAALIGCSSETKTDKQENIPSPASEDVQAKIQELIPAATGIKVTDFEHLANSGGAPKESDVKDKSLTLIMLTLSASPSHDSPEQLQEFSYMSDSYPKPSKIAEWIMKSKLQSESRGPLVTPIPIDAIKHYSCQVEGEFASGEFGYELPELYRGNVNFKACNENGKWKITEFIMPARKIHLKFQNKIWTRVD